MFCSETGEITDIVNIALVVSQHKILIISYRKLTEEHFELNGLEAVGK